MNEEILKLADLSNVKVGDTIWALPYGEAKVKHIHQTLNSYVIETSHNTYTLDGKYYVEQKYPSAFTKNPFENTGFQERWMMVSTNERHWFKRKVFIQKNGYFIAWDNADTDEAVKESLRVAPWQYAKEIEEPKELELTLEEIAEKFGVSVESIKIKK
jgi:hypothetical protein